MDARQEHYANRGLSFLDTRDVGKLRLQGNIILGDFVFNTVDEDGIVWVITDISGWWQPPTAEVPDIERGWGDGSYDVQGKYRARNLSIEGTFLVPDPSMVQAARDKLVSAANLVYRGAWLKTGNDPIRASFVRLSGDVNINTTNTRGRTDFSIGLRAADPIKYSWNDASPDGTDYVEIPVKNTNLGYEGSGTVVNIGNYGVPCVIEVAGALTSPAQVYNRTTDQLIILTQPLKGSVSRSIINKQLIFDVATLKDTATLTTTAKHDFSVGDNIYISGVGSPFDGDQLITATATDTTFSFEASAATLKDVAHKALSNSVATLETTAAHGFSSGQEITINGVDSVFDGTYTISATPTVDTFTYSKTRIPPRTIVSKVLISNIATLTTSDAHNFILGEQVTVTGVDSNFNGVFPITAIPSPTEFSYAATRTNARFVTKKAMTNDVVTLTTSGSHGFVEGEAVNVTGVDLSLDGGYTISSLTSNTFSYRRVRSTQKSVITKSLTANVATLTTSEPHGYVVGESVVVSGVDSTFNGTYVITQLPSTTTFSFAKVFPNNISAITVLSGTVRSGSRVIKSRQLIGNVVTITTVNAHGALLGEQVTISGIDSTFNGTYAVTSIPTNNTFTYVKTESNVPLADVTGASVSMPGSITEVDVFPEGLATVAGSLPFQGASGTASVSDTIARTAASGKAIKKNDVQFTPGVTGATAVLSADILEIDTKDKEVAFNGVIDGARNRIDVLADFIELAPGENTIEFEDNGNPESTATLRVYYRSGWLA
jgi:predicted RNA-binding protein